MIKFSITAVLICLVVAVMIYAQELNEKDFD